MSVGWLVVGGRSVHQACLWALVAGVGGWCMHACSCPSLPRPLRRPPAAPKPTHRTFRPPPPRAVAPCRRSHAACHIATHDPGLLRQRACMHALRNTRSSHGRLCCHPPPAPPLGHLPDPLLGLVEDLGLRGVGSRCTGGGFAGFCEVGATGGWGGQPMQAQQPGMLMAARGRTCNLQVWSAGQPSDDDMIYDDQGW